ncbi:MAG: hypothetical protein RLZZ196_2445 [Bacteroidota bacterium]
MPFDTFKSIMYPALNANLYGTNMAGFASGFASAYDLSIKAGGDMINNIPMLTGNRVAMESFLNLALSTTQYSSSTTLLDVIGQSVIVYWAGMSLLQGIPPIIPAVGAIVNITNTYSICTNPGVWTPLPVPANTDPNLFINAFVSSALLHLTTVSGFIMTLSTYPPPGMIAPGIVFWQGYKVL